MKDKRDPLTDVPLHSIELEQGLLGALLMSNANFDVVAGKLQPEHFFEPLHQTLFAEIARKIGRGEPATPLTVRGVLPGGLQVAGMGGNEYLARLAAESTIAFNVPHFADAIVQYGAIREHVFNARGLVDGCMGGVPIDEALKAFHDVGEAIRMGYIGPGLRDTSSSVEETMAATIERMTMALQGNPVSMGVPTGLAKLDVVLGGLQRSNLVLVGGRASMGKSSLGISMARQIALQRGKDGKYLFGVGFFSLEMDQVSIGARMATDHIYDPRYPVAYNSMIDGSIQPTDAQRVVDAERDFRARAMPLEFDFANGITVSQLSASARRMAAKLAKKGLNLDVLFVDYLKFVKSSDRYWGKRNEEVAETIAALRTLARVMNCCVVVFHQLNREVEKTAEKRPSLEHLRESGAAEEDADVVILLYREAYYLVRSGDLTDPAKEDAAKARKSTIEHDLDLIVAKQRMGPAKDVKVFCDVACSAVRSPHPSIFGLDDSQGPPLDYR